MKDNSNSEDDTHDGEEDAISLSDFQITENNDNQTKCNDDQNSTMHHDHQSSDFFEFFNYDLTKDISHADDIILCGKLIPFHNQNQQQQQENQTSIKHQRSESQRMTFRDYVGEQRNFGHHHRRWESFSELTSSPQWNSPKTGPVCSSRSLGYQKLRRNSSVMSVGRVDSSKVLKPRWYVLMFGSFRFRPEMELRDIKNRQVRRAPAATMFQPLDGGGKKNIIPVSPKNGRKSSWCMLKALVCKGNVADDVTASVGCMPKA